MKRIQGSEEALIRASGEKADANRFYSILLDARASSAADNVYDVAEKLLGSEKENAKQSLDRLWSLKKNVHGTAGVGTVDILVQHYQDKIDALRSREERIGQISRDSRKLLEEKRRKDSEIASVKQSLSDLTREISELQENLEKLMVREQELLLIGTQLTKELEVNETEIVNGLYEIILPAQSAFGASDPESSSESASEVVAKPVNNELSAQSVVPETGYPGSAPSVEMETEPRDERLGMPEAAPPYPKSVVKTTKGRIIGEYFYDRQVYKNKRHYILNSRFFLEQSEAALAHVIKVGDETHYNDMLLMVQDAYKRISEHDTIHFEISTNELLNTKSLKELWSLLKTRQFEDIERFVNRLRAKIVALGPNYNAMLVEQMTRLAQP